ncbi:MAG: alcohol dehydrogenase catalytic domain-containing protein [Dermatophilaceae bacterium]
MRALRYESFGGPVTIEDVPEPTPTPQDAIVEVARTGLCRSDYRAWMGHDADVALPCIPGHEYTGIVRAAPSVPHLVGRRVAVPFVIACGDCPECQHGNGQVCRFQRQPGFTDPGSFAEFVLVPRARVNLVPLPDGIGDDAAASLGCRFGTAWRALTRVAGVRPGDTVVVFGAGGVGLAAIMIASAMDAEVVAVDVNDEALALADRLGAHAVPVGARHRPADIAEQVREILPDGASIGVDAVGSSGMATASLLSLRRRGRHVQVGLLNAPTTALPLADIVSRELTVLGSHGMAASDYPDLLARVEAGALQPQLLVTGTVGLAGAANALTGMGSSSQPSGIRLVDPKS